MVAQQLAQGGRYSRLGYPAEAGGWARVLATLARRAFISDVVKGRGVSPWAPTERISGGVIAPWTGRPRRSLAANQFWNQSHPLKQGERYLIFTCVELVKGVPDVSDPLTKMAGFCRSGGAACRE